MSDENTAQEAAETTPQAEPTEPHAEPTEPQAEAAPGPEPAVGSAEWKYKKNLGINEEMKKVIHLTMSATQSEIAVLRRKLDRLTYGS